MIRPLIHRSLRRQDLALLVDEIARADRADARAAAQALDAGAVDEILDAPAAVAAVRGHGGAPAPLPLTLLWYVPIRATLRARHEADVTLADYAASLCVALASARASRVGAAEDPYVSDWWEAIAAAPAGTTLRAERAADCGAVALWWAGCFPEAVAERGGAGALRAFTTFAGDALAFAARGLAGVDPDGAALCAAAAARAALLQAALADVKADYLGPAAHTSEGRLERFLRRLGTVN